MLDLDKLNPKPYKVILGGKEVEVYPAKIRATMEIERYFQELNKMQGTEAIDRAFAILNPLIPALAEDKTMDFTIEQLLKIMQLVYRGEEEEPKKDSTKKK